MLPNKAPLSRLLEGTVTHARLISLLLLLLGYLGLLALPLLDRQVKFDEKSLMRSISEALHLP